MPGMPASGLASYSQEEGKEIRENQDSANVTKRSKIFRKPPDCDDKKGVDKANTKLAITKQQAGSMKKKTAIAVKKAQQLTDKLNKESDLEKRGFTQGS